MLHYAYTKKMAVLLLIVCVVLGLFFIQQQYIISKSAQQPIPTPITATTGNIIVSAPYNNSGVPPNFLVQGKARVFENIVSLRISNKVIGKVYYTGNAIAQAPDAGAFGAFTAQVHLNANDFSLRPNDKLTLEVFQQSAKDGSDTDLVTIPLYFSPELP